MNNIRINRRLVSEELNDAQNAYENKKIISGLASGFKDFDILTRGFEKGDLIIIASRPSMGKTALALNIAANIGIREDKKVAIFSLEMSKRRLVRRLIESESKVESYKIRTGNMSEDEWARLLEGASRVSNSNIVLDDCVGGLTPKKLRKKCKRIASDGKLELIIIDYLQLMDKDGRSINRPEDVTQISNNLKLIAKELNVPIIALSQLSRNVEDRTDKRPMMSDLREIGAIELDADIITFLYRDDYYYQDSERTNTAELIIGKHRNGELATIELAWIPEYIKFANKDYTNGMYS